MGYKDVRSCLFVKENQILEAQKVWEQIEKAIKTTGAFSSWKLNFKSLDSHGVWWLYNLLDFWEEAGKIKKIIQHRDVAIYTTENILNRE